MAIALTDLLAKIDAVAKRAGRQDHPTLMAVSKLQPIEKMRELYDQGQRVFGENYVQELIDKKKQFDEAGICDIDLQFIGHLQTNKVKALLPHIQTIHSIDSFRLLDEIEKRAAQIQKKIYGYFQVNIDEETSKGGFFESDLTELVSRVSKCQWLIPTGLMCIPDPDRDPGEAFSRLKKLSEKRLGLGLSMGMSDDYELAIERGSTVVRMGSALFGPRKDFMLEVE